MQRNELLSELAELYLTGLSPYELTEKVDFVPNAIKRREQAILWLMQEKHPKLHYWWINHHLYQHKNTTALVQRQKNYLANGFTSCCILLKNNLVLVVVTMQLAESMLVFQHLLVRFV